MKLHVNCLRLFLLLGALLTFAGCATDSVTSRPPKDLGLQDTPWGKIKMLEVGAIRRVAPLYPPALRAGEVNGTVTLLALIDENGNPAQLAVVKSSGYTEFDQSASRSLAQWQFPVWSEDGKPAKFVVRQVISFSIGL